VRVRLTRWSPPAAPGIEDDEPGEERRRAGGARRRTVVAVAASLAAVAAVVGIVLATTRSPKPLDSADVGTIAYGVVAKALADEKAAPAPSAAVYQKILPSVVAIETTSPASRPGSEGLGTGVIVDKRGSILTAYHVVGGATTIRVSFADGTRSPAEVMSIDPEHDIAVVLAEHPPTPIVPAVLGGGVQIGDDTYAVGNPLGYVDSITAGVVSGLDRSTETPDGKKLRGLIQFDAAVNPGNSGGPLLNRAGQVVGIVTALANPARRGFFIGIGFAVPIGTAGGAANAPPK
jgi:S1-C subfamily serine protease